MSCGRLLSRLIRHSPACRLGCMCSGSRSGVILGFRVFVVWRNGRWRLREWNEVNEPVRRRAGPSPRGQNGRRGPMYTGAAGEVTDQRIASVSTAARAAARSGRRPRPGAPSITARRAQSDRSYVLSITFTRRQSYEGHGGGSRKAARPTRRSSSAPWPGLGRNECGGHDPVSAYRQGTAGKP